VRAVRERCRGVLFVWSVVLGLVGPLAAWCVDALHWRVLLAVSGGGLLW
jgi:hypothetical protein